MRIIAGSAKGRTLKAPASITRPTMDRVRAAIFSILGERVPDARVLDLFAGTGAMGIEALSRGAAEATLVDQDKQSVDIIRQNLILAKLAGDVKQVDAISFLKHQKEQFDLIFTDPPYFKKGGIDFIAILLESPHLFNAMTDDGLLILECGTMQSLPEVLKLEKIIDRTYGISRILIFRKNSLV